MHFTLKNLSLLAALMVSLPLSACSKKGHEAQTKKPNPVIATGAAAEDPGLVEVEGALANRFVPADRPSDLLVRVRISADAIPDAPRPPINLMLVVDTSGSMEGQAITNAREAAASLVGQLEDGDQFGLVVFHSEAQVLVPSTKIDDSSLERVRGQIKQMRARGTTDLSGGLSRGLSQISSAIQRDGVNRIVLLSDGVPNDASQVHGLAQNARNMGVSITALGLGLEYDETLLSNVARLSGGNFHFVEDSTEVAAVFRDEVLRLERIAAANTTLALRPGPGVGIVEVVGQPFQVAADRSATIPLGELSEGEKRDVFVRLQVGPHVDQAPIELMDAIVGFDDPVNASGRHERSIYVSARATADGKAVEQGRVRGIELSSERARAAAAMIEAIALSRAGNLQGARALLDRAEPRARAAAGDAGDAELLAQADEMVELRSALPAVVAQPAIAAPGDNRGPGDIAVEPSPMGAPEPFPESAPATIRRSHDRAMRKLQGGR